jgi:hypothetical protein
MFMEESMSAIKLFESKKIRSVWDALEEKWYFSVVDVVGALTDSSDPKDYWYRIKKREKVSGIELSTICRQLKLESADGKKYRGLLRASGLNHQACFSGCSFK